MVEITDVVCVENHRWAVVGVYVDGSFRDTLGPDEVYELAELLHGKTFTLRYAFVDELPDGFPSELDHFEGLALC